MKKDIWLKPGKQINNGAIVGGIGFVLYMAFSALGWSGIALIVAIGFGLESLYTFLSTLEWREKDKESVSYSIMWGTAALALLMLVPAVMTIKQALGLSGWRPAARETFPSPHAQGQNKQAPGRFSAGGLFQRVEKPFRQSHFPYFSLDLILALISGERSFPAARTGRLGSLRKRLRTSTNGSTA